MSKRSVFFDFVPISLVYFLDFFVLAMVYPIFGSLVLNPDFGIEIMKLPYYLRTVFFGLLTASYPLAQYLGSFVYVPLSHVVSRKSLFTWCILGMILGLSITTCGIVYRSYIMLFLGRLIGGFFAGNIILAHAFALENEQHEQLLTKRLFTTSSVAFILGVSFGGGLSESHFHVFFSNSTPFYLAIFVAILIWVVHFCMSRRSKDICAPTIHKAMLFKDFRDPTIKQKFDWRFINFFIFLLAWFATIQYISIFFIKSFGASRPVITFTFIFLGICYLLGFFPFQALLRRVITSCYYRCLFLILFLFLFSALMAWSQNIYASSLFHVLYGFYAGAYWSNIGQLLDSEETKTHRMLVGYKLAILLLAAIISPILTGFVAIADVRFVYIFTSFLVFLIVLISIFHKSEHDINCKKP